MQDKKRVGTSAPLGRGWSSLYRAFEAFRKRKLPVIASFLVLFLALCGWQYSKNLHTARTVLSLDYEEASQGLAPNRTRFNIYEIRSPEVMERLIEYAGLEGEITPDELSRCVSVKATHNKNISSSVNYISTSFIISFTGGSSVGKRSAEDMLNEIRETGRVITEEHTAEGTEVTVMIAREDTERLVRKYGPDILAAGRP